MRSRDVAIAGAGLIGAALALELAARGLDVLLFSAAEPLAHASTAAAGMLAAGDPENPRALRVLAAFSRALYPEFLSGLAAITGTAPPRFQTAQTLQALSPSHPTALPRLAPERACQLASGLVAGGPQFTLLDEASLDPRELAAAVRLALDASPRIDLYCNTPVHRAAEERGGGVRLTTAAGVVEAAHFVDCTGAWASPFVAAPHVGVHPRKGQLLTVALPPSLPLGVVVRTPEIYIVPRLHGAQAGRAVIGATIEDRGFNTEVEPAAIATLQAHAAQLLPALAEARVTESWAGLRPATSDGLPLLGRTGEHTWVSKGHFRNGILLAPGSARVMAQLILGQAPAVDLTPFSPLRTPQARLILRAREWGSVACRAARK